MLKKITCILLFLCCGKTLLGQTTATSTSKSTSNQLNDELISRFDQVVEQHLKSADFPQNTTLYALSKLYSEPLPKITTTESLDAQQRQLVTLQQELLREDWGLSLQAGYLENFEADIFTVGEIYYKRRGRVELQWDLLKNGLFENRHKAKALAFKKEALAYDAEKTEAQKHYELRYNAIIYTFNKKRIAVLKQYDSLQEVMVSGLKQLVQKHFLLKDKLIAEEGQQRRIDQKLKAYQAYNRNAVFETAPVKATQLPVVDVNLDKLKAATKSFDTMVAQTKAYTEPSYNPLYDIRLSLFARYSLYGAGPDRAATVPVPVDNFGGREYFSAGVNLSIPLPFNASEKRAIHQLKQKIAKTKLAKTAYAEHKTVINTYYEYEFALQQYIQFYGKYIHNQEKIRRVATLKKLNNKGYSPVKLTELIAQRYQITLALIDLKQKLYLKLLKIDSQVNLPLLAYIKPVNLPHIYHKNIAKNQQLNDSSYASTIPKDFVDELYVWTEGFSTVSNQELLSLLMQQGIQTVSISLGAGTFDKARKFIQKAHQQHIKVDLLVGNNLLIYIDTRSKRLQHYVQQAAELSADGLHLDVEPHSFDNWEEKKQFYKRNYIKLLKRARKMTAAENLKLTVSIPHFYDDILPEIKPLVDQVDLMVYETNRVDQIISRVKNDVELLGYKAVIALRAKDFDSLNQLNKVVRTLKTKFPKQRFALHDLRDFKHKISHYDEK